MGTLTADGHPGERGGLGEIRQVDSTGEREETHTPTP